MATRQEALTLQTNWKTFQSICKEKKALRQAGFKVDLFKNKSLQECIDFANNAGYTCLMKHPNQKSIEGEHEDRLYHLHKYVIKWCRNLSLKVLIIRLVGANIEKL